VSPREIDALEAVPASRYLVELLACDRATGRIVTRLADGPDLHTYANTVGQFPIAEAVSIGIDLCHALNVMHGVGYIHRDIKPLNVVKTARNAVLIDLGLAEDPTRGPLSIAGTPYYIAPEQFDSTVTPDAKADL
jgi:serine/threonine protein kinase